MIPAGTYLERRIRAASKAAATGLDGIVVSNLVNIRYLTGFTGSNGLYLLNADWSGTLFTDGRYKQQAIDETGATPVVSKTLMSTAAAKLKGTWGCETNTMSVDTHRALREATQAELVSAAQLIEKLRAVKDDAEIAALERACDISVQALRGLLDAGNFTGRTERQVARDLEQRMFDLGAEAVAFGTILASGPNSAIPHHRPTDRVLEPGDFVKIDFGARVDGYHADCTRTFVIGPPSDWQQEVHGAVQESQAAGVAALRVGLPMSDCDHAARDVLKEAGLLKYFTTGIGHGVGLEIHEQPFIGRRGTTPLSAGTAVTVEPGVYVAGRGGVRIEDTVVVGETGSRVLTELPRDLRQIA